MKKFITLVLALICVLGLGGCVNQNKEQPLRFLSGTQKMVKDISNGNLDEVWGNVYHPMAEPNLQEKLEYYVELLNGREIKRCDCYDYERTGDPTVDDSTYTEITYYKIYLTEDYSGEPDFYAKAVGIKDSNGEGTISLEIYEEAPQK